MKVGLIGAGNMARAMARGWDEPVLISDTGSGRAQAIVDELGGEAFRSNLEVAERADLLVLCHKPHHLHQVAKQLNQFGGAVVSVLGATKLTSLQGAYPQCPVFAMMPNTPVEVCKGVIVYATREESDEQPAGTRVVGTKLEQDVLALFDRLGTVVPVASSLLDAATSVTGVGPAYQALLVEAQIDAAVRQGIPPALAAQMVIATVIGSAELIAHRGYDTLSVRREVTSPGGSTARGLDALERSGVRTAFQNAADAVVQPKLGK